MSLERKSHISLENQHVGYTSNEYINYITNIYIYILEGLSRSLCKYKIYLARIFQNYSKNIKNFVKFQMDVFLLLSFH